MFSSISTFSSKYTSRIKSKANHKHQTNVYGANRIDIHSSDDECKIEILVTSPQENSYICMKNEYII